MVEVLEEFLDVFGLVACQTGHADDLDELVKRSVANIIPTEVAVLEIRKCPPAIRVGRALRQNGLHQLIEPFVALMPGALAKVCIQSPEDCVYEVWLSHRAGNGMIIVNQYHYSIIDTHRVVVSRNHRARLL
jgi:hypothetical protein